MKHQDRFKVGWSEDYGKNYDKIDWSKKKVTDSGENQQKQGDGENGKNQH